MYDSNNILRCTENGVWKKCENDEFKQIVDKHLKDRLDNVQNKATKYYGQKNNLTNKFCIRDVSAKQSEKGHKRTSGKVCTTWKKPELNKILKTIFDVNSVKEIGKQIENDLGENK